MDRASIERLGCSIFLGVALLLAGAAAPATAAESGIAPPDGLEAWLPDHVSGYVKFSGIGDRLVDFLKSDARSEIESLGVVKFILSQDPWRKFQEGLEDFRSSTGKDPLQVFRDFLGREVVLGFKPDAQEIVLLTLAPGEKELDETVQTIRKAIGSKIGYLPEGYRTNHLDRTIETFGEISFASLGRVFVLSNRTSAVQDAIELSIGKSKGSVKNSPLFQKGARGIDKDALASFALRPRELPQFRIPERFDNPLGSLLLGGLAGALEGSELITGALRLVRDGLEVELSSIAGDGKMKEKYRSYFPETASDGLKSRLEKRGILAWTRIHRDLKAWWDKRDDLMIPGASGQLLQLNSVLTMILGGKNFQDEILPRLGPTITIVARNQEFKGLSGKPLPSLPAFAGIFELKDAKDLGESLHTAFMTAIGFVNIGAAQKDGQGKLPFTFKAEKVGDVDIQIAAPNLAKDEKPGLIANFSPSLAVVGSRVVLSSSDELAKILVEEVGGGKAGGTAAAGPAKDSLAIESDPLKAILRENFELLVADSMKKGKGRENAEGELNALLDGLRLLRGLTLETRTDGDAVRMAVKLNHKLGALLEEKKKTEKKAASF